jgi:hypothetical protein
MVTAILSALVETLAGYMFSSYFDDNFKKIDIDNAPSWYLKSEKNYMCTFSHKNGGLDSIDMAKNDSREKMIKRIDEVVEITIYDNLKHVKNEKEKAVIDIWKSDINLPIFVNKHLDYRKIEYKEEKDISFVSACIPKEIIINYQKDRLSTINKKVLGVKVKSAFSELNSEDRGENFTKDPNNPFSELEDFR